MLMQKITPFIWFHGQAEEAMNLYVSIFPNSKIVHILRYEGGQGIPGEEELKGKVLTGIFELEGQQYMCIDGGDQFELTGAISLLVNCESQAELDQIWDKLVDGGTPVQCGWLTDKFGVTWQIVPTQLDEMMGDAKATPAQKEALMKAMMPMVKLDIQKLKEAFEGAK